MKKIKLMNKIAKVGTDVFDRAKYEVGEDLTNEDAIMVRSAALHDVEFADTVAAIARCGAGVNNIPVDKCTDKGIVVFNTPGANANGVKELALCALILAARDVVGGIKWAETLKGQEGVAKLVEKGKGPLEAPLTSIPSSQLFLIAILYERLGCFQKRIDVGALAS